MSREGQDCTPIRGTGRRRVSRSAIAVGNRVMPSPAAAASKAVSASWTLSSEILRVMAKEMTEAGCRFARQGHAQRRRRDLPG